MSTMYHGSSMNSVNSGSSMDHRSSMDSTDCCSSVDNRSSMNSVDHRRSMDSMDHRSSLNSMNHGSGVDSVNSVDWCSSNISTSRGRRVLGLSGVSHLSNVSSEVVSIVSDSLSPAVRKVDRVRSTHSTSSIVRLRLLEVGVGVVVSYGVGVGVRGGLGQVRGSVDSVNHGGGVLGGGSGGGHQGEGEDGLEWKTHNDMCSMEIVVCS